MQTAQLSAMKSRGEDANGSGVSTMKFNSDESPTRQPSRAHVRAIHRIPGSESSFPDAQLELPKELTEMTRSRSKSADARQRSSQIKKRASKLQPAAALQPWANPSLDM